MSIFTKPEGYMKHSSLISYQEKYLLTTPLDSVCTPTPSPIRSVPHTLPLFSQTHREPGSLLAQPVSFLAYGLTTEALRKLHFEAIFTAKVKVAKLVCTDGFNQIITCILQACDTLCLILIHSLTLKLHLIVCCLI